MIKAWSLTRRRIADRHGYATRRTQGPLLPCVDVVPHCPPPPRGRFVPPAQDHTESACPQAILVAQRVCAAAGALFFLCFLLSGSGGGLQSSRQEVSPAKRRLSSGDQHDSTWHLFSTTQRPATQSVRALSWEEARTWVRQRLEALVAADGDKGWQAVADPLAALQDRTTVESDTSMKRRRQLLGSYRVPGRELRQWWDRRRAARRRLLDGVTAAGSQGIDPDSLDVPADDADEGDDEGGAEGRATAKAPTALVVVPTANVWNTTAEMIRTLEMCRDRFELLVGVASGSTQCP